MNSRIPVKYLQNSHVRLMPEWLINLKSSSGKEIIRENHDVFPRGVSSLFELNGCSIPSLPAPAVKAALFKVVRPNLLWALEGFGVDYNSLCLSQGQIIDFARRYPHFVGHGYGTWILFKVNLGFFFATLHTYSGNDPNIDVCSLSEMEKNYCVDYKGCTLVIPFRR